MVKLLLYVLINTCVFLKALDNNGKCQKPVFPLGVSQHMHEITNLWKFELNWSSKLRESMEEKTPLSHKFCAFRRTEFEVSAAEVSNILDFFFTRMWNQSTISEVTAGT